MDAEWAEHARCTGPGMRKETRQRDSGTSCQEAESEGRQQTTPQRCGWNDSFSRRHRQAPPSIDTRQPINSRIIARRWTARCHSATAGARLVSFFPFCLIVVCMSPPQPSNLIGARGGGGQGKVTAAWLEQTTIPTWGHDEVALAAASFGLTTGDGLLRVVLRFECAVCLTCAACNSVFVASAYRDSRWCTLGSDSGRDSRDTERDKSLESHCHCATVLLCRAVDITAPWTDHRELPVSFCHFFSHVESVRWKRVYAASRNVAATVSWSVIRLNRTDV